MKISVVYITNRNGCLDLMTASLLRQRFDSTKVTFELVVIDGYPGRVERGEAQLYLTEASLLETGNKLPLRAYASPRPKTFPWSRTGFANAMNSGVMLSGGDYVVFLHDYTHIEPNAIELWYNAFTKHPKTLISGVIQWCTAAPPDNLSDISTWKSYPLPMTLEDLAIPRTFEVAYWGAPISFFDECNGIDERADFCSQYSLYAVQTHAKAWGYETVVDTTLACLMVRHHDWDTASWYGPHNSEWRMKGVYSDVPKEPVWTGWGANPYNMAVERRKNDEVLNRPIRLSPRYHVSLTRDTPEVAQRRPEKVAEDQKSRGIEVIL